MAKTALLALLPALLIATGWQRLEDPALASDFSLAALLGILVVLVPRLWARIAAGVAGLIAVASLGFDLSPLDARPFDDRDFFGPLLSRFGNGVLDFYEIGLPFDPAESPRMHGTVVLAVFAFTLLATLAIRVRRPVLAAATMFEGAAWPVTLVPEGATARGVLMLVAALILLAALRPNAGRGLRQAAVVGAAVVLAAVAAVSTPAVAKGGFLDWQRWEPYSRHAPPVSVQYVWDADYDGIEFPKTPTTVLRVKAPRRRAPYWRATTLDIFLDDKWREGGPEIEPVRMEDGREALTNDPYLPPSALDPASWMEHEVTIEALQDGHLPAASVPIAFEADHAGAYGPGIAYVGRLRRGQDYKAWSYAPQPTPVELTRSAADYPEEFEFGTFLSVGTPMPTFDAPGREAQLRFAFGADDDLAAYEPLYRVARQVVGRPENPYAAAVALEAWFRTSDTFTYDETPPPAGGRPPLVAFVDGNRRGYCQHFAGAMALMLRYLGIPARVAAGFTSGRFDDSRQEWVVSDTNAHTWVEVWFDGYGWLPFDPTPGRGRLRGSYTSSSLFFDANGAVGAFAGVAVAALGVEILRDRVSGGNAPDDRPRDLDPLPSRNTPRDTEAAPSDDGNDLRLVGILLAAAAGFVVALWLLKVGRRRARYLNRDPRARASAARAELTDYLADQRLPIEPSATAAELSATMWQRFRVDGDRLASALGEARYGPEREAERAERVARRELRAVVRRLRRRLGARSRLRGVLSLRSFGLRST